MGTNHPSKHNRRNDLLQMEAGSVCALGEVLAVKAAALRAAPLQQQPSQLACVH